MVARGWGIAINTGEVIMHNKRRQPRAHERNGLAGVGTNADTRPGSGSARRCRVATNIMRADKPQGASPPAFEVQRPPPPVRPVKTRWTWTPEQRRDERRARSRGAGTSLCPATPEGHVPNWRKAMKGRHPSPGSPLARMRREILRGKYS